MSIGNVWLPKEKKRKMKGDHVSGDFLIFWKSLQPEREDHATVEASTTLASSLFLYL